MKTSDLDYVLPEDRIARYPSEKRDASKLLVFDRKTKAITHSVFRNLADFIDGSFDFFRNDAAVLKGRIFAKKDTGARVECLLLKPEDGNEIWSCMLKPGKRLKKGSKFGIDGEFEAEVLEKSDDGCALVKFGKMSAANVLELSEKIGVVPLPPYIGRDQNSPEYDRSFDNSRYQTVYANPDKRVAAAAPTAGLHFTKELQHLLEKNGNRFFNLTLHVGIGTFKPLTEDIVENHKMHSEIYEISEPTERAMRDPSRRKIAVGTTSLRAMEDFLRKFPHSDTPSGYLGEASLFVYPPQTIVSADALITNFHLPRSTLMCLVGAFLSPGKNDGVEILKKIYAEAVEKKYNFYSYGDAMLIL